MAVKRIKRENRNSAHDDSFTYSVHRENLHSAQNKLKAVPMSAVLGSS